ncbi:hypothetical protein KC921_04825 [Candidatus Woesebacteria bacterium]|nr:hypothetical protein [Candidatus Woesebacteria bacterium]
MKEQIGYVDSEQWAADTERLLIAGLSNNIGPTFLDYDEETVVAVMQRCVARFGVTAGEKYFMTLLATLPDRRPELFPELADYL